MKRLAVLLLLVVAMLPACHDTPSAAAGGPAPDLAALDLADGTVRLADHRGKVVLVNFWIAECGPCLAEMPGMDEVYRNLEARGFEILAVNTGQDVETVRNAVRRLPISFPVLADPLRIAGNRYGVVGVPTSFLIDRDGILRERIDGALSKAVLRNKVEALL